MRDLPKFPSFVSCRVRSAILACGPSNAREPLFMLLRVSLGQSQWYQQPLNLMKSATKRATIILGTLHPLQPLAGSFSFWNTLNQTFLHFVGSLWWRLWQWSVFLRPVNLRATWHSHVCTLCRNSSACSESNTTGIQHHESIFTCLHFLLFSVLGLQAFRKHCTLKVILLSLKWSVSPRLRFRATSLPMLHFSPRRKLSILLRPVHCVRRKVAYFFSRISPLFCLSPGVNLNASINTYMSQKQGKKVGQSKAKN